MSAAMVSANTSSETNRNSRSTLLSGSPVRFCSRCAMASWFSVT
jgi:hypothetical protein